MDILIDREGFENDDINLSVNDIYIGNECIAINILYIETTVLNTIENEQHDGFRDL